MGFVTAGISTASLWLANAAPDAASSGIIELGGTVGLVGGLSYGCITLWKSLQDQRHEFTNERKDFIKAKDELEKEIRNDWKAQNTRLVNVLERMEQKDTE